MSDRTDDAHADDARAREQRLAGMDPAAHLAAAAEALARGSVLVQAGGDPALAAATHAESQAHSLLALAKQAVGAGEGSKQDRPLFAATAEVMVGRRVRRVRWDVEPTAG